MRYTLLDPSSIPLSSKLPIAFNFDYYTLVTFY